MVYSNEKSNGALEVSAGDHGSGGINSTSKDDNTHIWEHPWTTNEIRKNSSNWTLAGDVGLLNHLKDFSHKLISRTHEMEKVVDSLVHRSKVVSAKVNNVINDFQMLSNLQFVENRVYDEEAKDSEPALNQETQPKTKEQREAEMVPRIVQALELGISVLDKAFERIDVEETSESEDEEDISQGRTILEPKDIYEHRPLPYIIGSKEFQNDDHAGLHNIYEEDVSTDISTQDENISASAESESEEEEESDYEESHPKPVVIAEHKSTKSSVDTLHNNYSESEGSDLFDAEEEGVEKENDFLPASVIEEAPKENVKSSLIEELMKKTKATPPVNDSSKPESIQSHIPNEVGESRGSDDLFASSDNFMEDDDSPFHKKSSLFPASGLFGSQKEENYNTNLFDEDVSPPVVSKAPKLQEQKATPIKREEILDRKTRAPSNFFDDDDDDSEHDLFSSVPTPLSSKESTKTTATKDVNRNGATTSTPVQSKKNKSFDVLGETKSSDSLFGDDSDENDLFFTSSKENQKTLDFGSLVNDDDDDDLFSTKSSKAGKTESKVPDTGHLQIKEKREKPLSLFDESDSFDLFKPIPEKKEQHKIDNTMDSKQQTQANEHKIKEVKPLSLFEESDSFTDSREQVEPNIPKSKKVMPSSLFEESDSFVGSEKQTESSRHKTEEMRPSSLFEESDSFDLFRPSKEVKKDEPEDVKKHEPKDKVHLSLKLEKPSPVDVASKIIPLSQDENQDSCSGFDQPISSGSILTAINKDRVKIQAKRRKPTRKGRRSHLNTNSELEKADESVASNVDDLLGQNEMEPDLFSSSEALLKTKHSTTESTSVLLSPSITKNTFEKNEQSKKNLMSQLISEAAVSKIGKKNSSLDTENGEDDLFTDKDSISKSASSDFSFVSPTAVKPSDFEVKISDKTEVTKGQDTNVLLSDSTSSDDLFSASAFSDFKSTISDKNSVFDDDDDDDIFKPLKNKDTNVQISGGDVTNVEDDIFAGVDKEKYEMFPTQTYNEDDDDDDIFSNIAQSSKSVPEKLPAGHEKKDKRKDSDDIFSDPLGGLALND